ncbi:MAG: helix-turn-helix transcriptional regulator [Burkholderiaceae bacterium]
MPLTQAEISRRTGIPQPRLCRWEAGQIPVSADDALKLQALLNGATSAPGEPTKEAA